MIVVIVVPSRTADLTTDLATRETRAVHVGVSVAATDRADQFGELTSIDTLSGWPNDVRRR